MVWSYCVYVTAPFLAWSIQSMEETRMTHISHLILWSPRKPKSDSSEEFTKKHMITHRKCPYTNQSILNHLKSTSPKPTFFLRTLSQHFILPPPGSFSTRHRNALAWGTPQSWILYSRSPRCERKKRIRWDSGTVLGGWLFPPVLWGTKKGMLEAYADADFKLG